MVPTRKKVKPKHIKKRNTRKENMESTTATDSSSDEEFDMLSLIYLLRKRRKRQYIRGLGRRSSTRKCWVRKIFTKRESLGEYHRLVQELRVYDREYFFR